MGHVLLLGGSLHLQKRPVDPSYGSPMSHCNGVSEPERYHRAIFHLPVTNDKPDKFWYVYVTDDYQLSSKQLTLKEIAQTLQDLDIPAHITDVQAVDLRNERRIS